MPDSADFGDIGVNTLGHISESVDTFEIQNLQRLGMANITPLKQVAPTDHPLAYYGKLREKSRGKDGQLHGAGKVKASFQKSIGKEAASSPVLFHPFRAFPRVGHGVGQAVDSHFGPHLFQRFCNKKASKAEAFDAFWSWWCDSNT